MFFDGSLPILDLHGKGVRLDATSDKEATIVDVVELALLAAFADEKVSTVEKVKRYKLAAKIVGKDLPVEITVDDATMIKKVVGELPSPLIVGRVHEMIEAMASKEEKKSV